MRISFILNLCLLQCIRLGSAPFQGYGSFSRNFSPLDVAKVSVYGVTYGGKEGYSAAIQLFRELSGAVHTSVPNYFRAFCGGEDEDKNKREFAAFFALVVAYTDHFYSYDEYTSKTYCSTLEGTEWGRYPCCVEEDKTTICEDRNNCPYGCNFKGRGPLLLRGNNEYGRFSRIYFRDDTLLRRPETLLDDGVVMWASAVYMWMRQRTSGGNGLPYVTQSMHDAMQRDDGGGFGQVLRLYDVNLAGREGGMSGAAEILGHYHTIVKALGVTGEGGCDICDVSGMRYYDASGGKVGNPQIGERRSESCPDCGIPQCRGRAVNSYHICAPGGYGNSCPYPLSVTEVLCWPGF